MQARTELFFGTKGNGALPHLPALSEGVAGWNLGIADRMGPSGSCMVPSQKNIL